MRLYTVIKQGRKINDGDIYLATFPKPSLRYERSTYRMTHNVHHNVQKHKAKLTVNTYICICLFLLIFYEN